MAQNSSIEWTETTWNPTTGCTKISHGCKHCYAERLTKRWQALGMAKYKEGFSVATHEGTLDEPRRWKKGKVVFVNSMSDLFHAKVPSEFILRVFEVMNDCSQHQFQVLTKRPERVRKMNRQLPWADNIWMGTSVESERWIDRVASLRETDAKIKFLSLEPLLAPLPNLNLKGMDWVIVGGESGPGARPMKEEWVTEIQAKCKKAKVPFFFKQWGGVFKKKTGRTLNGRTWDEMPGHLTVSSNS